MRVRGKAKGAAQVTSRFLQILPESGSDVYEFDEHDASPMKSASSKCKKPTAEFRFPTDMSSQTGASRKHAKKKMLYSTHDVIEASQSGKTSTPCPVTGHQKTKKKTPGTPAPWVELPRLQRDSFAAYAVSPIAVEHHSPNDLSRQIDVNSMFDDTSAMDDSAISIPLKSNDVTSDKISVASSDNVISSGKQYLLEYVDSQENYSQTSDKQKSDTDSGYPKSDSQSEFISLSAGSNIEIATKRIDASPDDLGNGDLLMLHDVGDSGDDQNVVYTAKQVLVENNENELNDCEVIMCKLGKLDAKKFSSSAARSTRKFAAKRRRGMDDVEPTSDDDSGGASSSVKSKGKPNQLTEDAASKHHKQSRVLKVRNIGPDSNSVSTLFADTMPSTKCSRKTNRKTESAEMSTGKSLEVEKIRSTAGMENAAMHEKVKSRDRPRKKQNTKSGSKKQTSRVREAGAVGPDLQSGDVDAITVETFFTSLKTSKKQKVRKSKQPSSTSPLLSKEYMERMQELNDIAENYDLIIE